VNTLPTLHRPKSITSP